MFNNHRYITKGIKENIGIELQIVLWNLIDALKKKQGFKIDYLQVFELRDIPEKKDFRQEIIHRQEVEPYNKSYLFIMNKTVNAKIFVIDDGMHSTMMLADEY